MNMLFVGQIKGAKVGTRKDKVLNIDKPQAEVIVQYEDYDKNGELVLSTEIFIYEVSEVEKFKSYVNKFISVPMLSITSAKGTFVFQNEDLPYSIYETNPLVVDEKKKAS